MLVCVCVCFLMELPDLCRLTLRPQTAGLLELGKPDYSKPPCEAPNQDDDDDELCSCAICMESLTESIPNGAPWILHECSHQFHWKCLKKWVNTNKRSCPRCRSVIPEFELNNINTVAGQTAEWIQRIRRNWVDLELVPRDVEDYHEIALLAVNESGAALRFVPTDIENYREIAMDAVTDYPRAVRYVPVDNEDYVDLMKVAMLLDGDVLRYLPVDRNDYFL